MSVRIVSTPPPVLGEPPVPPAGRTPCGRSCEGQLSFPRCGSVRAEEAGSDLWGLKRACGAWATRPSTWSGSLGDSAPPPAGGGQPAPPPSDTGSNSTAVREQGLAAGVPGGRPFPPTGNLPAAQPLRHRWCQPRLQLRGAAVTGWRVPGGDFKSFLLPELSALLAVSGVAQRDRAPRGEESSEN